ncbi:MAG TPA: hypothetical protein VHZ55_02370 [Bryobacteraceae bacterium]|nr:hypothetical protein [Bryobacteraceae bacterium]
MTRYRISLEQARYASSTINLRLAAMRRLAYEAADASLLSSDIAAGIRRVKGHAGGELEQIQFLLGHVSVQITERYLGCKRRLRNAVNRESRSDAGPAQSERIGT